MIEKIELEYMQKNSFSSAVIDGICHVKSLPYLSIVQAVEGSYDIQLGNGEMYATGAGGFFIAPSDIQQTIIHHADKNSNKMVCRWVFLKIKLDRLYHFDSLYEFPVILPDGYKERLNEIFDTLFGTDDLFHEYVCYYEIIRLLSLISQEKAEQKPSYLHVVLEYIKNHYREKITVAELAKTVHLSGSYFFSVFKKTMGVSPIAYLNNYRLAMAVELLMNSEASVSQISHSVGIEDAVYFNKMFRKAYQMSPSEYRRIYKGVGRVG